VVLLAWCDDPADPQHAISAEALQLLTLHAVLCCVMLQVWCCWRGATTQLTRSTQLAY
jgi:hypothetical protein